MYQNIYDGLITKARELLDVASLLEEQKIIIEQLKKKASM